MVFLPYAQWPDDWRGHLGIAVRTIGDPAALAQDLRRLLSQAAPGIRGLRITTLEQQLDRMLERQRFAAGLSTLFGILALCLVAVGLYGVVAYLAASRTTEFGVRMALGAEPSAVMWIVLRESIGLSALGIGIGLPLAIGAAKFSAHQLFKVPATDPITILCGAAILLFVATVSALIPAARASRADPMIALRGT
jgi:ABC-type antimicrobial peptide transport system permease subunit